jgi:hypothetical protein
MTNSTQEAKTMEIENDEMVVRLRFDRPLSDEDAARMAGVMAEEMEFRDPSDGRYTSPGWGIGKARVLGVTQLLPGDLAGVENAEMLALRLQKAGRPELAPEARAGRSRAELLQVLLESVDPDPEVVAILVGRPGAQ